VEALLYGENVRRFYELHGWVVMPNHVHVIFQPHTELSSIMRWLKGRTSRVANQILGRTGTPFWQNESFDHWIRSAEELEYLIEYVENNPLRAGLVEAKEQWRWSSAGWMPGAGGVIDAGGRDRRGGHDRRQKPVVYPTSQVGRAIGFRGLSCTPRPASGVRT